MDLRTALYTLAATHRLDTAATGRLLALAGFEAAPAGLRRRVVAGLAVLAAGLLGFGLVLWIAANWAALGRFGRFGLLLAAVLLPGLTALARPAWRAPLGLAVLLATGALFAYFGQTYQTGADAWTLFALWAGLTLPLAWGLRSDVVWAPWVLVALVAVALWIQAHTGHGWRVQSDDLPVHLAGWGLALGLVLAMATPWRRWTGAGLWSLRTAAALAVVLVSATALAGLLQSEVTLSYALGLLVLAALAGGLASRASFDAFAVSAALLGLNVLLVVGLVRLLFESSQGDPISSLLIVGLVAAGLLAASVQGVMALARRHAAAGGQA